jgi:tetratricopeptide (TPR) repeat protein
MSAMFLTRRGRALGLVVVGLLLAVATALQMARDRQFATDAPAKQEILYVQSTETMKRFALSYAGLAADIYWIRAIQYFGGERRSTDPQKNYGLLYPLLNISTSLDPRFNIAYRFGAIFLSEDPPRGPGRPDLAIALLQKGIAVMPEKWEYYQDLGYVHFWARHDYSAAAEWFRKGSEVPGAPWFLKPLAAHTLAAGGDRHTARLLYQALAESRENDFMQKDAHRRLRQLDAMDAVDALNARIVDYKQRGGGAPFTWQRLVAAHVVPGVPIDPDGVAFALDPATGEVHLDPKSTLLPLPSELLGKTAVPSE